MPYHDCRFGGVKTENQKTRVFGSCDLAHSGPILVLPNNLQVENGRI